jgi:hypothetical protein
MIEKTTGTISFPTWTASVSPTLTRAGFLESPISCGAKISLKNDPWCSWDVLPVEWDGKIWHVTLYFNGESLAMIHIGAGSPEFGSSWGDWSEEKEMARKSYHERVLARELDVVPGDFPWGTVASVYDSKSGSSVIIVNPKMK